LYVACTTMCVFVLCRIVHASLQIRQTSLQSRTAVEMAWRDVRWRDGRLLVTLRSIIHYIRAEQSKRARGSPYGVHLNSDAHNPPLLCLPCCSRSGRGLTDFALQPIHICTLNVNEFSQVTLRLSLLACSHVTRSARSLELAD